MAQQRTPNPNELRDHLANERTLLAWIRTAVAMMGMGFVVAKFSLLLRELVGRHVHRFTETAGNIVGSALVMTGFLIAAFAVINFDRVRRGICAGEITFSPVLGFLAAAVVMIASIVLTIYLVLSA